MGLTPEDKSGLDGGASRAPSAAVGHETPNALQELDLLLPKVCEAMVLVVQCFSTVCLADGDPDDVEMLSMRDVLLAALSADRIGLLECCVGMSSELVLLLQ